MNTITDHLNWRYAVKSFDPQKKINSQDFHELTESLRLSPSSFGLQCWGFCVVENDSIRQQLLPQSWNQKQITDCSHLIVLCTLDNVSDEHVDRYVQSTAKTRNVSLESLDGYSKMIKGFIKNKSVEQRNSWLEKQVYIALGTLMTVASMKKIDSCPIEGFSNAKYDEILGLKEKNLRSAVVCALGYRHADDKYAQLKKVRFDEKDIFHFFK